MTRALLTLPIAVLLLTATPASATTFFAENFEAGSTPFGWTLSGLWEVSTCNPFTGSYALTYASPTLTCTYNAGFTQGRATLPTILIPVAPVHFLFMSYKNTENSDPAVDPTCPVTYGQTCDNTDVQISTDGGATWTTLFSETTENAWNLRAIDVSAYSGQNVMLSFFFDTFDSAFNDYGGWSIDDVSLGDVAPPVPELPTLGLILAGAGLIGAVAVRSKP